MLAKDAHSEFVLKAESARFRNGSRQMVRCCEDHCFLTDSRVTRAIIPIAQSTMTSTKRNRITAVMNEDAGSIYPVWVAVHYSFALPRTRARTVLRPSLPENHIFGPIWWPPGSTLLSEFLLSQQTAQAYRSSDGEDSCMVGLAPVSDKVRVSEMVGGRTDRRSPEHSRRNVRLV
jgi:hypothetical protein